MTWLYSQWMRPWLFVQDPEDIHNRTIEGLAVAARNPLLRSALSSFLAPDPLPVRRFGLRFPNPIGLAAGMDKHGTALPAWEALGFGFTELGGVTRHAQAGNPKPRMFRAAAAEALVNSMGFNNPGAEALASILADWRSNALWPNHPVGINLGKSKLTPNESAAEDYASSFATLLPHADFFVVNVSSPNTPNLRQLQDRDALDHILGRLNAINALQKNRRPILVKVAPDLTFDALDEIVELGQQRGIAGLVATNTTVSRPSAPDADCAGAYAQPGGLSGRPLAARSTEIIAHLSRATRGQLPIVGVGGIFTADDAWQKIAAGASLLQIYSGLVYRGPGLIREIVDGIRQRLAEEGFKNFDDAVGSAVR